MMNKTIKKYGYVEDTFEDNHYVLGGISSLAKTVLRPDHNWVPFAPKFEPQSSDGWDTEGCTIYGTQNAIEILLKAQYGGEYNSSERFQYNLIPVRPPGTSPHLVAECIRESGLVEDYVLPMTETFEEFITPYPMTEKIVALGQEWKNEFDFKHEWVFTSGTLEEKQAKLKEALTYSPLGISVYAWEASENGLYVKNGPDNHWCVLVNYLEGEYWVILDTYDQSIKHLVWDYDFGSAKRYMITKKIMDTKPKVKHTWLDNLVDFIRLLINK